MIHPTQTPHPPDCYSLRTNSINTEIMIYRFKHSNSSYLAVWYKNIILGVYVLKKTPLAKQQKLSRSNIYTVKKYRSSQNSSKSASRLSSVFSILHVHRQTYLQSDHLKDWHRGPGKALPIALSLCYPWTWGQNMKLRSHFGTKSEWPSVRLFLSNVGSSVDLLSPTPTVSIW